MNIDASLTAGTIFCGLPLILAAAIVLATTRSVVVRRIAYVVIALETAALLLVLVLLALDNSLFWFVAAVFAALFGWLLWTGFRKEFGGGRSG
jgi:hypothetical protein